MSNTYIPGLDFRQVRTEVRAALKDVCEKYGLTVDLGRITYSSSEFRSKITFTKQVTVPSSNATGTRILAPEAARFVQNCARYGLRAPDLNRSFSYDGTVYKLVGMRAGNTKYPFLIQGPNGGRYKGGLQMVKQGLGIS